MSEAEKLGNVEDVLSSIRRLVADGPHAVPAQPKEDSSDLLKKAAVIEINTAENQETQMDVPKEVRIRAAEPTKRLASFVETMNASIAKITQDKQIEVEGDTEADTETNNVQDEPLESDAEETPEADEPAEITTAKPEPLILKPAMAAAPEKPAETTTDEALDQNDLETVQVENETGIQKTPDEDAEKITLPDDIEDDEAVLAHEKETGEPSGAQFVDEDALRQIVSELVRSELQGDLGDRITRNVRKLVRREIHLALASRDVE
jgi:hypothetical protein